MKKLVLLILMVMLGLLFTLPTYADARVTVNGNDYDITNVDSGFNYTIDYNSNAEVLIIYPSYQGYLTTSLQAVWPYGMFLDSSNIEKFISDLGIDIQTGHTGGADYSVTTGFSVIKDEGDKIIRSDFNYLVIETEDGSFYYPILEDYSTLTVLFKVNYNVSFDDPLYVVDNNWQTDITINGVDFPYPIDTELDWSMIKFTLRNIKVDENQFLSQGNYRHWYGFNQSTWKTGFDFTENYFLKYIATAFEPYDNGDPLLLDIMINNYIEKIRTVGLTITLPVHYSVEIFVPSYFIVGINYWKQIDGTYNTINIRVPDLVLDGSYGSGELWGNTLIYTLGGIEYVYFMVDNLNNTIPPLFGIRLSNDYWQLTFDENGGTAVSDIYVGYNQMVYFPSTTRTGWELIGWTEDLTADAEYPWDSTYYRLIRSFPFRYLGKAVTVYDGDIARVEWVLQDIQYQALWKRAVVYIDLNLNGGQRKTIEGFTNSLLVVEYGETANDNVYDIPFNNMVYRNGYSLEGWYQDEALTIPFNPATPLTANITIYAKWLQGGTGESSPSGLNALLSSLGLLNDVGTFFVYLIVIGILYIPMTFLGLPKIIYVIVNITISGLWLYLGWFNPWVTILVILSNLVLYKFMIGE